MNLGSTAQHAVVGEKPRLTLTKARRRRMPRWEIWTVGLTLPESVQESNGNFSESQPVETITASPAPLGVSHAHFASGPPLFRTAAHQKSRIHADGSGLAGARHWSGHRCIQRDLRGADESLSLPCSGSNCTTHDAERSGFRGSRLSKRRPNSDLAAITSG